MPVILKKGTTIDKDPDADKPYAFDWSQWLGEAIINTSTWEVSPTSTTSPLVIESDDITNAGTGTQVRVTGGEAGTTYRLTNRVTTNESPARIDDRTLLVKVREL